MNRKLVPPATFCCLQVANSEAHDLPWLSTVLCSDALPEKHKWAVQACHENIPMATTKNTGILKAVTLTVSLQLIQQRECSTTAVQNHTAGNVFVYKA